MLRSRFFWKLFAGYAALILVTTGIIGVLTARQIGQDSLDETRQVLQSKAVMLRDIARPHLAGPRMAAIQQRIQSLGAETGTRLTVIRADGVVLADSEKDPERMDNHSNRPEVLAARSLGAGSATRFSNTVGKDMMYFALPVEAGGRHIGFVRTALPLTVIEKRLAHLRSIITLTAVGAVIAALILGFFVARRVTAPLTAMTSIAGSITAGEYHQRARTSSRDEVGQLALAFNSMAEQLQERIDTITREQTQLFAILGGMVEGVVAVDQDERVVHMNEAAGRILGVLPREAIGQLIWEVTRVHEVSEAIMHVMQDGAPAVSETQIVGAPNDRTVELYASPLSKEDAGVRGAVVVLHDVTELRRLETVRRDFVVNVSHELKTPITAIRGIAETLLDDTEIEPEMRKRFLSKLNNQSSRLATLVTDLLALSRLESETEERPIELLDLRNSVAESIRNLKPVAETKGVTVSVQLSDAPVHVRADKEMTRQMVDNLVDNAIKYTPSGGRIEVRLRTEDTAAVLEIQDTGIGIEKRHHDRIFERFYRVDKARSRELGGTGLGLSIVKHIARSFGGTVSVESVPGKGSAFRVHLPLTTRSV